MPRGTCPRRWSRRSVGEGWCPRTTFRSTGHRSTPRHRSTATVCATSRHRRMIRVADAIAHETSSASAAGATRARPPPIPKQGSTASVHSERPGFATSATCRARTASAWSLMSSRTRRRLRRTRGRPDDTRTQRDRAGDCGHGPRLRHAWLSMEPARSGTDALCSSEPAQPSQRDRPLYDPAPGLPPEAASVASCATSAEPATNWVRPDRHLLQHHRSRQTRAGLRLAESPASSLRCPNQGPGARPLPDRTQWPPLQPRRSAVDHRPLRLLQSNIQQPVRSVSLSVVRPDGTRCVLDIQLEPQLEGS